MRSARVMSLWLLCGVLGAQEQPDPMPGKPASEATKRANAAVVRELDFSDREDFADAARGLIARPATLTIRNAQGRVVWDMEQYKRFIGDDRPAPDTVNPSLWRNAQLNMQYGLFEVVEGIYQVRGYDLSNITFIRGRTGWIVGDPLTSEEVSLAAYELVSEHLGKRPIVAVIYSHSHADHYGGVRGVVDEGDVKAGTVAILAPEHFTNESIAENVMAGNAMMRRGLYMSGALLPRNATGGVNSGLGQTVSQGTVGLILPTDTIRTTGETRTIDGVEMVFQMTPGTEAPAEMNVFLPQWKAMWMAENATHTLHNLVTLRGAQVRNGLTWAKYIDETLETFGAQIEVEFASHHWPMWGNARIVEFLGKQRDLYKYIHDRSVNLMNQGYTGAEIAEMIRLPQDLARAWYNRGYYGTIRHNSRAVYQRYMGWYDGNPSSLDPLPPEPAARKYVEYMGGADAVLARARADFDRGEYRWVAEAVKHVVFADAGNRDAKQLLADAYEQLAYQAESAIWRSVYLMGAFELRNGVPALSRARVAGANTVRAMPLELVFDYWAMRLNSDKAAGKRLAIAFDFTDTGQQYVLSLENGVLNQSTRGGAPFDARLSLTREAFDRIQLGETTIGQSVLAGEVRVDGRREVAEELLGMLDTFAPAFNIVTP